MKSSNAGFSLIELMIVVAIIGILSTIAVPNFNNMAKTRVAKAQLQDIAHALRNARSIDGEAVSIIQISGNGCSACEAPADMNTFTPSATSLATWAAYGYENGQPKDPWGHYIVIDENDAEFGDSDCRFDSIYSAGPDGIYWGFGRGDEVGGDDLIVRLPLANPERCGGISPP